MNFKKLEQGVHVESIYPVFLDGCKGHITWTRINEDGLVSEAFSNSCGGMKYHHDPECDGYRRMWNEISHWVDTNGIVYESKK